MDFKKRIIEELDMTIIQANTLYKGYVQVAEKLAKEYHQEQLRIGVVSQQRELLLAYHKYLDSLNDPTVYNASESMIDDYLANNCG
jgi:hypothetical protein